MESKEGYAPVLTTTLSSTIFWLSQLFYYIFQTIVPGLCNECHLAKVIAGQVGPAYQQTKDPEGYGFFNRKYVLITEK